MLDTLAHRLALTAEDLIDRAKSLLPDDDRPAVLAPYRAFGTPTDFHLFTRLLRDPGDLNASADQSPLDNIRDMIARFESDEVPGVALKAQFGSVVARGVTDEEGYAAIRMAPGPIDRSHQWHPVVVRSVDVDGGEPSKQAEVTLDVLVPHPDAAFGVISDIDDTVLQTDAANLVAMLRTTLTGNIHTRLAFDHVGELYQTLREAAPGDAVNPFFYLSSSPWNLYDFIRDFLDLNGLPRGPIFLRDLGLDDTKVLKTPHSTHKSEHLRTLLTTYADLPFVLIGDSGQHDPEIYADAVREHPGRVRAVVIRDVTDEVRSAEVRTHYRELEALGVPLVYTDDSRNALGLLRRAGLIG
jgi:phosphatidate phosphatase APP1